MTERWMGLDENGIPMGTPQPRPQVVTIWYNGEWITTGSANWDDATFNQFNWFKLDLEWSEDYVETGYTYTAPETVIRVQRTFSLTNAYNRRVNQIHINRDSALQSVALPYGAAERETWQTQAHEAAAWLENNAAATPMLSAMVAASGGNWTLAGLAATIDENASQYAAAAGNILGQVKAKLTALDALKAAVEAETATPEDMIAFDPTITPATINLEEKF